MIDKLNFDDLLAIATPREVVNATDLGLEEGRRSIPHFPTGKGIDQRLQVQALHGLERMARCSVMLANMVLTGGCCCR
jgi:hypothetical protein